MARKPIPNTYKATDKVAPVASEVSDGRPVLKANLYITDDVALAFWAFKESAGLKTITSVMHALIVQGLRANGFLQPETSSENA